MMRREGAYPYFRGDNFEAASLPYGDGDVSMYIFLPNRDSNLNEFLDGLNAERWAGWLSQFSEVREDSLMILPRFKLTYQVTLNDTLQAMGMEIAFSSGADFSGMGPSFFISEVRHKTLVEINEEGTEAAAVTMVTTPTSASLPFLVNRPFFFAIYDNTTKTILFMGIVREPM
jgi:serpin B